MVLYAALSGNVWADLNDGLVAYYPFNGNARDASGNFNDGTVHGATLTEDRFGNKESAYSFDGNDDHILVGNNDSLNIDHRLTITAWIKKEANKSYAGLVGNDWFGYTLMFDKTGNNLRLELAHGSQHSFVTFSDSHIIENNTWYHIVIILDILNHNTNKVTFYVNGQKGSEKSTSYSDLSDMPKVYIGYEGYGNRYFKGTIDDIRIYNRALSESEIQQLYQGCQPSIDIILNSNNRVTGDKVVINTHIKGSGSLDTSCKSSKVTLIFSH